MKDMLIEKTININGFLVPEPVKKALAVGDDYFVPSIDTMSCKASSYIWRNDGLDYFFLKSGLIHLKEEHACLHQQAILSFTS